MGREAEAGEGARRARGSDRQQRSAPQESHGHSGHSGHRTARRRISSDSCSRCSCSRGRAVRSVPVSVPAPAPAPAVAPSCGCGCRPLAVHPAASGLATVPNSDVLTDGLAVPGSGAFTTSPESATASSQPGSPAASSSTPPQQSLVAPSTASSFHNHPRGRLVSRACDRCRRRKAKVSATAMHYILLAAARMPVSASLLATWSLSWSLLPSCPPLSLLSSPPPPLWLHGFIVHTWLHVCICIHNFRFAFTLTPRSSSASAYPYMLARRPSF